MEGQYSYLLTL